MNGLYVPTIGFMDKTNHDKIENILLFGPVSG